MPKTKANNTLFSRLKGLSERTMTITLSDIANEGESAPKPFSFQICGLSAEQYEEVGQIVEEVIPPKKEVPRQPNGPPGAAPKTQFDWDDPDYLTARKAAATQTRLELVRLGVPDLAEDLPEDPIAARACIAESLNTSLIDRLAAAVRSHSERFADIDAAAEVFSTPASGSSPSSNGGGNSKGDD